MIKNILINLLIVVSILLIYNTIAANFTVKKESTNISYDEFESIQKELKFNKELLSVFKNSITDSVKNYSRKTVKLLYTKKGYSQVFFDSTIVNNEFPFETINYCKIIRNGDTITKISKNDFLIKNGNFLLENLKVQ